MTRPAIASPHSAPHIPGYTIVEQLYLGSRTAVYRAVQTVEQRPVVIKVLQREYPSFSELVQFRNQYTIAKNLSIAGIVRPLSLEPLGSGYALVMEDIGGIALSKYIQQQGLELIEGLTIAVQLADILHDLGQHWVVHKDIKPANILIHPESKQIKVIDFSIASLLPKENQVIQSPNILEGTLAYLAPEQTGRMNRAIDYRTDFYALGVTLYHLLTGTLPFVSDDPLELIHCHMAKMPLPIDQVKSGIPAMVAAIVTKLMAKNAEDRYQSALGLKHDLEQCLAQWQATGTIADFPLGQRDLSDRFVIPEKLYGREAEVQILLNAFDRVACPQDDRVASGSSELMLVAGFSGIGKTAVVNEVHKPIVRQRGYFIKGKFDQFNRSIPLSAFVQALRDLMEQLLSESDSQLAQWQTEILASLGENGQVLIDVIPELEHIIGKQPSVAELSGNAAQNRFNLLFQKFIEVFTTAEHPLVIFLDDLQWADSASLQLIKLLMADSGYLLMLGAYRDNEVSPVHPFILTIEELKKAKAIVNTITLKPLTFDHTNHLVADTLKCSWKLARPITELINRKTKGNPFFTTQFLKALHEEEQIRFNRDRHYWECDIAQVNALSLTDDIVEFMALQLQKLPTETQQVLQLAACIGNQFDLATLAIVSEQSPTDAAVALWKALQEGFILPVNQVYKFFQSEQSEQTNSQNSDTQHVTNPKYRFLHDRVQQAAYKLIPDEQKQSIHLTMGQLLLRKLSVSEREEQLFEIVNHLNVGHSLISTLQERQELAQLNLEAGQKATSSTAYEVSVNYLKMGISLLPENAWEQHYDLTLALHKTVVEATCLSGDFEQMERWASLVIQHASTLLDTIDVQQTRLIGFRSQGHLPEAIRIGLEVLQSLGVNLPTEPTEADIHQALNHTRQLWEGQSPLTLLNLPAITDGNHLAAMQILSWLGPCAYMANPALMVLLICEQVELSIRYGNCPVSIYSYADYGLILCGVMGDISAGYRFGQLSLQLLEQLQAASFKCRSWCVFYSHIHHWQASLQACLPKLKEAFQAGLETGDWDCATLNAFTYCQYAYHAGQELTSLAHDMSVYHQVMRQFKQVGAEHHLLGYYQAVLNLLGGSESPHELIGAVLDEREFLPLLQAQNHRTALLHLFFNQTVLTYLFGHYELAAEKSLLVQQGLDAGAGNLVMPLYSFYDALIQLANYKDAVEVNQPQILEQVRVHQEKLQHWASYAPSNHEHRWQLVAAEQYRVLNQKSEAIEYYDSAIASAKANGYIQDAALANELAAKFYLNWGKEKIAASYLQEAYYGYARWGAKAKVQDLERHYPDLLAPILQQPRTSLSTAETVFASDVLATLQAPSTQSFTSGGGSISAVLDLTTVLKASQTLSSEIQIDQLLATLLHTVLASAGADKGVLLMPRDQKWFVEAVAALDQPVQVQSIALSDSQEVPHTLINNVRHSLQPVVIINAAAHSILSTDGYVVQHQPQSVLCIPILRQGKLVAILYLENQITSGAFTSDRVELLNFLCTQAAISLENARLYQQAQDYAQQLEHSLEQLRMSKARFQKLADNVPGLIYQIQIEADGSSSMPYVSSGSQALYEVAAEDLMDGKYSLRDFEHPDDKAEAFQASVESAQALTPFRHEWRIITPNGNVKWVQAASQPERRDDGKFVWDGIVLDITDRKRIESERQQAEATMRLSEERYRSLITVSSQIVWIATPDGLSVESPNWCAYTGQSLDKLKNFGWLEALHPDDIDHVGRVWNQARETKTFYTVEYRIRAADGTYRYFDVQGVPILAEDGSIREWIGACADIDERKRAENALIQKSEELAQALQNLQSTQLQMVQSEKMASLGNLVAGIAHEINNPIGFLNGSINNAKDYVQDLLGHLTLYQQHHPNSATPVQDNAEDIDLAFLSEDLPKLLDSMKGATARIKAISTSLRTFSRADTEHRISANLHEGLDSTLLILKYRLKANEHRPAIQVIQDYGDLPLVECFPGQLNQVFMNILANAIDVFDEAAQHASFADLQTNPQQITIQTAFIEQNTAEIRISDNGRGMTEDIKARIFDHLFTTKSVGKGTGLGLAIAQQIVVEKHEGTIEVYSVLGKGTEFVVHLPTKCKS
jgi:PAS domain S-box-containing protein